jgi:hypothetical protein
MMVGLDGKYPAAFLFVWKFADICSITSPLSVYEDQCWHKKLALATALGNDTMLIFLHMYYYYILHLSAKRYEELLAIRLGKPLMDKTPRRASFAPFLCSPLLIYNSRYYHMLYLL